MSKNLLVLLLGIIWSLAAKADDLKTQDKDLSDIVGRVFLTLSNGNTVSGKSGGIATLWVNARMAEVQEPMGKGPDSAVTRPRQELVPDANGIVLYFIGPFDPRQSQKAWAAWHNAKTGHFEFTLPDSKGLIAVQGWYGSSFSPEMVKQILSLNGYPIPNQ